MSKLVYKDLWLNNKFNKWVIKNNKWVIYFSHGDNLIKNCEMFGFDAVHTFPHLMPQFLGAGLYFGA